MEKSCSTNSNQPLDKKAWCFHDKKNKCNPSLSVEDVKQAIQKLQSRLKDELSNATRIETTTQIIDKAFQEEIGSGLL